MINTIFCTTLSLLNKDLTALFCTATPVYSFYDCETTNSFSSSKIVKKFTLTCISNEDFRPEIVKHIFLQHMLFVNIMLLRFH
jgi:hypothetical protein